MTYSMTSALPDPDRQAVFYDGIPAKRLFAWVVDVALIFIAMLLLGVLTLSIAWFLWPLFWIATSFLYRSITIASGSATLGMRLMNIELRNAQGQRLNGTEAMMHTGGYLLCASFFLPHVLSIGMIALSQRHQSLPDAFLGTAAINRPQ
ncbi:RDD family protein [Nioella sp.]|uniref:RDD family protein n=1 Tax=Nioella sp. TaxID=1912091 RepID=UPI003B52561F